MGQKRSTTWQEIQSDPTSLRCQNYKGRVSVTDGNYEGFKECACESDNQILTSLK
jgi:hypothetical protein